MINKFSNVFSMHSQQTQGDGDYGQTMIQKSLKENKDLSTKLSKEGLPQ